MDPATPSREVWGWWRVFARDDRGVTQPLRDVRWREVFAASRHFPARPKPSTPTGSDAWPIIALAALSQVPTIGHSIATMLFARPTPAGMVGPWWLPATPWWWLGAWLPVWLIAQVLATKRCAVRVTARASALRLGAGRCLACAFDLRSTPSESDGCTVCPECGAAWRISASG
jgi:hypothetical protein